MKLVEREYTYLNERFTYYPSIELFDNGERTDNIVNLLRIDFADGARVRLNAYVRYDEECCFDFPEVYLLPREATLTETRKTVVKAILRKHNYPRWLRQFVEENIRWKF